MLAKSLNLPQLHQKIHKRLHQGSTTLTYPQRGWKFSAPLEAKPTTRTTAHKSSGSPMFQKRPLLPPDLPTTLVKHSDPAETMPTDRTPAQTEDPPTWPEATVVIRSSDPKSDRDVLLNHRPPWPEDQKRNRNQGKKYTSNKDKLRNLHLDI